LSGGLVVIDGAQGEGGGQIVRSSLALSILTGRPLELVNIRAGRAKPGLLRQHLCAVQAAARVGAAHVTGAELGSRALRFEPNAKVAGHHEFRIGSAGSTSLVLQTVLPPLLVQGAESTVVIEGGTHNPLAPTADFLANVFAPVLARMGASLDVRIERHGFYPAGGGKLVARVGATRALRRVELHERGELVRRDARILVSSLPAHIGAREAEALATRLGLSRRDVSIEAVSAAGPGNVVSVDVEYAHAREHFAACGARGKRAEDVAAEVCAEVEAFDRADVPVGPHLADQLLLPMALAGGGTFRTTEPTLHTRTNAEVLRAFVDIDVRFEDEGEGRWFVRVGSGGPSEVH
jgi:RNA 3'-terminal phosphate cyclase (ATP)